MEHNEKNLLQDHRWQFIGHQVYKSKKLKILEKKRIFQGFEIQELPHHQNNNKMGHQKLKNQQLLLPLNQK
jgi:hypothetical protein